MSLAESAYDLSFDEEPNYDYLVNLLEEASKEAEVVNIKAVEEQKVNEVGELFTNLRVNESHSSKDDLEKHIQS